MHILIIPSWYPTKQNNINGIFFQEQAKTIAKYDNTNKVGVISATYTSIMSAFKTRSFQYGYSKTENSNFKEYIFSFPALPKNKYYNQKFASYICKKIFISYIKENGIPNIIHLHSFEFAELVIWIHETCNIPYVYTEHASAFYHDTISTNENIAIKLLINKSSANFAVSNKLANILHNYFKVKFVVMPNFIDTSYFICNKNTKKDTNFTFINIASLDGNKNHTLLLSSFKIFQEKYPDSNLLIYGDGPDRNSLISISENLEINEKVIFGGKIRREEVRSNLCKSHCFILSSKVETFGVVAIEAMSCGIPVISTKNGGTESIITNNTVGVLCEQDKNSMLEAMEKLYLEYDSYNGEHIRQHVIDNFSEEAIVKQLINTYKKVLDKR